MNDQTAETYLVPQGSQLVCGDPVRDLRVPEVVHVLPGGVHSGEGSPAGEGPGEG